MYEDIILRDNSKVLKVDLYMAGFPCQPFSSMGRQRGANDEKCRGDILWRVFDYIEQKRPKIFILDNVQGFVSLEKGRYVEEALKDLNSIGTWGKFDSFQKVRGVRSGKYSIYHQIIDTKDHGIPHSRQRWYCIGILNHLAKNKCINRNEFKFPEPRTCPSIGTIVGSKVSDRSKTFSELGKIAQQNVLDAEENIFMGGFIPESAISVVDIDSSAKRCKAMSDVSPCLTRSRYNGHWLTQLQRRMTVEEMLLLQGMDPGKMKGSCSRQNLGKMVGNSMSVNVLERVLSRALNATDLVLRPLKDRWDNENTQMKPTPVIAQPQQSSHKQCHAYDGER